MQIDQSIFETFRKFINQRPGLDPRNYFSDWRDKDGRRAYQSEARSIQQDGKRARTALALAIAYPFDPAALADATSAFSGRLQINPEGQLEYCTGQYFPTEYRKAAATVLERYIEIVRPKQTPCGRIPASIAELKDMNRAAGGHFFDRGAMRCFRSRVVPGIFNGPGGIYFVSSESNYNDTARSFTVRKFDPADGSIDTFGEFNKWTRGAALRIAKHAAASNHPLCHVCGGEGSKYDQPCWHCKGSKLEPEQAAA